jgi:hypothetical protein
MNKKILVGAIILLLVTIIGGTFYFLKKDKNINKKAPVADTVEKSVIEKDIGKIPMDSLGVESRKKECLMDISLDKLTTELNIETSNSYVNYLACRAIEDGDVSKCDAVKSDNKKNYSSCVANVFYFAYLKKIVSEKKCPGDFCFNDNLTKGLEISKESCNSLCSAVAGDNLSECGNISEKAVQEECNLILGAGEAYCDGVASDEKEACLGDSYMADFFRKEDTRVALLKKIKQMPDWSDTYIQADRYVSGKKCDDYFKELLKNDYCSL